MFPETLAPAQRWWLLLLLGLWAILLFGGFLFGVPSGANRMPVGTRMASSLVLVVAGWSWYLFSRGGSASVERYALLIAVGMTCGFVGDLAMARLLPLHPTVLWGIAAFGVGHVFYIGAFLGFANVQGLNAAAPRWAALATWLLVGVAGWYAVVYRRSEPGILRWAALLYALLLASTAGVATGLALQARAFAPLALGAGLFLFSDLLLAGQLFGGLTFPLIGDVIWLTYGAGQLLIVYSIAAATRLSYQP